MKKTILITMLVLLGAFGLISNAQAASCSDVIWSAGTLADNPNIAAGCLDVVEKQGVQSVKMRARVVRQSVNSTIIQWQMPDGTWSPSQRRYPERGATAEIGGQTVKISDLAERQEVNVYVPMADNWSLPAATAPMAAAPAPVPEAPAAAPEPAPEPAPAALPTTATQVPLFALLGGLFILMGGMLSIVRARL